MFPDQTDMSDELFRTMMIKHKLNPATATEKEYLLALIWEFLRALRRKGISPRVNYLESRNILWDQICVVAGMTSDIETPQQYFFDNFGVRRLNHIPHTISLKYAIRYVLYIRHELTTSQDSQLAPARGISYGDRR